MVPTNNRSLGASALSTEPVIEQVCVCDHCLSRCVWQDGGPMVACMGRPITCSMCAVLHPRCSTCCGWAGFVWGVGEC